MGTISVTNDFSTFCDNLQISRKILEGQLQQVKARFPASIVGKKYAPREFLCSRGTKAV